MSKFLDGDIKIDFSGVDEYTRSFKKKELENLMTEEFGQGKMETEYNDKTYVMKLWKPWFVPGVHRHKIELFEGKLEGLGYEHAGGWIGHNKYRVKPQPIAKKDDGDDHRPEKDQRPSQLKKAETMPLSFKT
ncbi:MAG: hypothetical protein Q9159_003582 [Coniocarpon cinnabarinum]